MAILPRTLLTQPAPAAVAAISIFGFALLGMSAFDQVERERLYRTYETPCQGVEAELGARQFWQEVDHLTYIGCLEHFGDEQGAVDAASWALMHYPDSEELYNVKGYHQIGIEDYQGAVQTLETGIRSVELTNGVMENNLAWSYLWTGDGGTERARALVRSSLDREPSVCEVVHTGLFVEFAIARSTDGIEQAEALRNFERMRSSYDRCTLRNDKWDTMVEAAGAAVLYAEVEHLIDRKPWDQRGVNLPMVITAAKLRQAHPSASMSMMCAEALPFEDLRLTCVEEVQAALAHTGR